MDNIFEKLKNACLKQTWLVFFVVSVAIIGGLNPFGWRYITIVGGTFLLHLYRDKVRDALRETLDEIDRGNG